MVKMQFTLFEKHGWNTMEPIQAIGLISGFLLAMALSIRLEAYCVRLSASLVGTQVSDRASIMTSVAKVLYGLSVGWVTGFFLARDEMVLGAVVAIGGAAMTPVLYKQFMRPDASWWQAVVVSLLVPVGYTLTTLSIIGVILWGTAVFTGVLSGS